MISKSVKIPVILGSTLCSIKLFIPHKEISLKLLATEDFLFKIYFTFLSF